MIKELSAFITHARSKGMDHQTIRMLLLSAGWKEKDIAEALASESLDVPVPLPPDRGGARDAFFHLLTFAGLYTVLVSLVILFFTFIERLFPDPALGRIPVSYDASGIRWSMAAVIVAFPFFILLSRFLTGEMQRHPEKAASGVRRWLTYLTLFLAASVLIGDFITLVFSLLQGELSVRFILKVLVVLAVAGCTFTYYFVTVRSLKVEMSFHRLFAGIASAAVAVALFWGFVLAGSPPSERARQFDERRLEDLRTIQNEITNIVFAGKPIEPGTRTLQKALPKNLDEVAAQAVNQRIQAEDPETGAPYEYRVLSETRYELCATFSFERTSDYDVSWDHPAGRHCYQIDALDMRGPIKRP